MLDAFRSLWGWANTSCFLTSNGLAQKLLTAAAWVAVFVGAQIAVTQSGFFGGTGEGSGQNSTQDIDRTRLEIVEDLSESLANDLLDLSVAVRDRDLRGMAEFMPAKLSATPFPSKPLPVNEEVKWIGKHAWTATTSSPRAKRREPAGNPETGNGNAGGARRTTQKEFLRAWQDFLAHFTEIEDVRFKVKEAFFDESAAVLSAARVPTAAAGSTGRARVAFFIIGRDAEGRREWARGVAEVRVRRGASGRWQFDSFVLVNLDSQVAATDLFSEVTLPAGVAASRPPYGSAGNTGFVWHGAAAADFNADGWIDLFVAGPARSYLYLNNGQGRFREAAAEAGLELLDSGVAPLALDYDNDGDADVFISAVGPQMLLENRLVPDGKLVFRDVSLKAGVAIQAIGFSAVASDVNRDGFPDIYVCGYNHYGRVVPNSWYRATNGTPNLLFINQGDGTFREEAARWGVDDRRWSYAAGIADVNGDGRLDLYVANDFGENGLFINQGERFVDEAQARGVLDPGYGMGVSFGDYNNDGQLDLHVTNMSSTAGNRILSRLFPGASPQENVLVKLPAGNNLFESTGDGRFRDVTREVGGLGGAWAWGGAFIDFDNDGWEDLFTPNGFISGKSMKDT